MKETLVQHFEGASYDRYPWRGNFTLKDGEDKRSVTLWHNSTFQDIDTTQPRFFEEDSVYFFRRVPLNNRMTSDNYNNLLQELEIPPVAADDEYGQELVIYATKPTRWDVQKLTVESTDGVDAHRRIRKQTLRRREIPKGVTILGDFDQVVDRLHDAGLVYAADFSHWTTGRAISETTTRVNKTRR